MIETRLSPGIVEALSIGSLPDVQWKMHDDLCDCVYQRIGLWTNPYIAETLEVRMCCIWAKLYEQFPDQVRTIPAFWNYNSEEWVTEPMEWNGETAMPRSVWYRQLARQQGRTIAEVRAEYASQEPPQGKVRGESIPLWVQFSGEWVAIEMRGQ
jgi:hypothetical protein